MGKIVQTHDLWKIYPMGEVKVEALRGVNLTVEEGEFITIIGPSGSGKSSLLHIIGCMDTPTRGEVFFGGKDVRKMSDGERTRVRCHEIGYIFQTFNLLPTLDVAGNVEIATRLAGMHKAERKARTRELLEKVGLGERMGHLPRQLSGGERQRVAIARALANSPKLILADEPTGNLDSVTGKEIVRLLRELNEEGHTIVLVTHDLEASAQARRVIKMKDGQLQL